ncbi:hypothetical protein [Thermoanaerobacterium sp. RBIITD]|uniref:hypothetical protein n=1 Tax=Thermoanaerobacterium sp. RBIITD TaxID=1550240 RepID=UPI000BB971E7|nr:hypothetical protein [Thermoanaerobacterium sp. RBIITD]SNX52848.1 hypothetical protein SAMN05660242_0300 [Thermoanaerobacterium sp. RBIITD]
MECNADYLISLIGTNPLPAFITILKNADKNTKIKLVYTKPTRNNISSKKIAENLSKVVVEKIPKISVEFVECDKSNTKKIQKCIKDVIDSIKKDAGYGGYARKVILDYSSGTKVMSALFTERFANLKEDILAVTISYVDDDDKQIFEYSYKDKDKKFPIKEIVNRFDLSVEDITRIHGYSRSSKSQEEILNGKVKYIKNPEFISSKNGLPINVDEVYILDGRLIMCFKSKYENKNKSEYKMELFKIKDISDKLGGSKSEIIYQSDCNGETVMRLKKDIKSDYEYEMDERASFINLNESFVEKIIEKFKIEGGN